jgi:hypothetical protein
MICERASKCKYEPDDDKMNCPHKIIHEERGGCNAYCRLDSSIKYGAKFRCVPYIENFIEDNEFTI